MGSKQPGTRAVAGLHLHTHQTSPGLLRCPARPPCFKQGVLDGAPESWMEVRDFHPAGAGSGNERNGVLVWVRECGPIAIASVASLRANVPARRNSRWLCPPLELAPHVRRLCGHDAPLSKAEWTYVGKFIDPVDVFAGLVGYDDDHEWMDSQRD
jgi:hypothetical protein